jgi:transposase InsO family protein
MEDVEEVTKKHKGKESRHVKPYGFEFKLRCVKLRLEEGIPLSLLSKEVGASKKAIGCWANAYRERGEAGLRGVVPKPTQQKLPGPVREKIVEIKKQEPLFGVKRISQLLKRVFFLSASPETVRRTLRSEALIVPSPKKPQRNMTRPRFFERSTPNQLWQSDIFTFRLGGRYAYLIGFIDDYSRYMVGLELYRTQTADQVLEVYRRAIGEYGVPKEMLTDRGRQYTNWRGTTRFERELTKDRIKHIRSQAHHPMTLGKIERFWKTIYEEFLVRAQFGSFEEARERIRHWLTYYNHKRPHQGIGGLCPADRYFEIQGELRKAMEQGIADNILEMALRGKPKDPFYMVGRMEGQSVVLRAEKGKLRLLVDDEENGRTQEMVYDVSADENSPERRKTDGKDREGEGGDRREEEIQSYGRGEMPGGAVGMDRATQTRGGLPGIGSGVDYTEPLAGTGDGGDAPCPQATGADGRENRGIERASCGIVGTKEPGRIGAAPDTPAVQDAGQGESGQAGGTEWSLEAYMAILMEMGNEGTNEGRGAGACAPAGVGDPESTQRRLDGDTGGASSWGIPQDVLRVGGEVVTGDGPGASEPACGQTAYTCGPGEGGSSGAGPGAGEKTGSGREDYRGQRTADDL